MIFEKESWVFMILCLYRKIRSKIHPQKMEDVRVLENRTVIDSPLISKEGSLILNCSVGLVVLMLGAITILIEPSIITTSALMTAAVVIFFPAFIHLYLLFRNIEKNGYIFAETFLKPKEYHNEMTAKVNPQHVFKE